MYTINKYTDVGGLVNALQFIKEHSPIKLPTVIAYLFNQIF